MPTLLSVVASLARSPRSRWMGRAFSRMFKRALQFSKGVVNCADVVEHRGFVLQSLKMAGRVQPALCPRQMLLQEPPPLKVHAQHIAISDDMHIITNRARNPRPPRGSAQFYL